MQSHKWRNKYVVPGGKIELGEKAVETLKREVKEETEMNIYDIKFLCWQDFVFDKAFWKKRHFIFLDFVCKTRSIQIRLNAEAQNYVWVTPIQALKLPAEPYTKKAIRVYLNQHG